MDSKIPNARWFRVIVPIMIACIISFMDRVNISFALPGGMESDLAITSQMAGLAGGIFFIGYLFLQVPGGRIAVPEVAGGARGVINGLGNLGGFCGPYLVGVMIFFYGQSAAVCMLAGSLIIAGLITLTLPKECDVEVAAKGKGIADKGLTKVKRA